MPIITNDKDGSNVNLNNFFQEKNNNMDEIQELTSAITDQYAQIKSKFEKAIGDFGQHKKIKGKLLKTHEIVWGFYEKLISVLEANLVMLPPFFRDFKIQLDLTKGDIDILIRTVEDRSMDESGIDLQKLLNDFEGQIGDIQRLSDKDSRCILEKILSMRTNVSKPKGEKKLQNKELEIKDDLSLTSNKNPVVSLDSGASSFWINFKIANDKEQSPNSSTNRAKVQYVNFDLESGKEINLIKSCMGEKDSYSITTTYIPFTGVMQKTITLLGDSSENQREGLQFVANLAEIVSTANSEIFDAHKNGRNTLDITNRAKQKTSDLCKKEIKPLNIPLDGRLLIVTYLKHLYLENFYCLKTTLSSEGFSRCVGYIPKTNRRLEHLHNAAGKCKPLLEKLKENINRYCDSSENKEKAKSCLNYFERSYQSLDWLEEQLIDCCFSNKNYLKNCIDKLRELEHQEIIDSFMLVEGYSKKVTRSVDKVKNQAEAKKAIDKYKDNNKIIESFVNALKGYELHEIEISTYGFALKENTSKFSQEKRVGLISEECSQAMRI